MASDTDVPTAQEPSTPEPSTPDLTTPGPTRPELYQRFERPIPQWYADAKLGIFVHWGPYSVPAWAEPIGELGTIESTRWFAHNPYAEWYYNTIRIEDSPAAEHQREVYDAAPYDDFLDAWHPDQFDADDFLQLVASTGAGYFVPTTKHHDGVTLWDAPETDGRNTVARGPKRDLVREFEQATRAAGLRFGVYYSGGLDWHFSQLPAITGDNADFTRPNDLEYATYAYHQLDDLIERYSPDILWGDINWPDAGKPAGPVSIANLFEKFYATTPQGVVNDRWGETHWDFRTSEYQAGLDAESSGGWENTRGIGLSFGYNQLEDERHLLSGPAALTHFIDVVSRGGNLLLNVGLTAAGTVPDLQRRTLEHIAAWNALNGKAVFGSTPLEPTIAVASDDPWVRWTRTGDSANAFIGGTGDVALTGVSDALRVESARFADGSPAGARREADGIRLTVPTPSVAGPTLVSFDLR